MGGAQGRRRHGVDSVLAAGLPVTACCCVPLKGTTYGLCLVDCNMAAASSAAAMYAESFLELTESVFLVVCVSSGALWLSTLFTSLCMGVLQQARRQ